MIDSKTPYSSHKVLSTQAAMINSLTSDISELRGMEFLGTFKEQIKAIEILYQLISKNCGLALYWQLLARIYLYQASSWVIVNKIDMPNSFKDNTFFKLTDLIQDVFKKAICCARMGEDGVIEKEILEFGAYIAEIYFRYGLSQKEKKLKLAFASYDFAISLLDEKDYKCWLPICFEKGILCAETCKNLYINDKENAKEYGKGAINYLNFVLDYIHENNMPFPVLFKANLRMSKTLLMKASEFSGVCEVIKFRKALANVGLDNLLSMRKITLKDLAEFLKLDHCMVNNASCLRVNCALTSEELSYFKLIEKDYFLEFSEGIDEKTLNELLKNDTNNKGVWIDSVLPETMLTLILRSEKNLYLNAAAALASDFYRKLTRTTLYVHGQPDDALLNVLPSAVKFIIVVPVPRDENVQNSQYEYLVRSKDSGQWVPDPRSSQYNVLTTPRLY